MEIPVDPTFVVPLDLFDNREAIAQRVAGVEKSQHASLSAVLRYLYLSDGPMNVSPPAMKVALPLLSLAEQKVVR